MGCPCFLSSFPLIGFSFILTLRLMINQQKLYTRILFFILWIVVPAAFLSAADINRPDALSASDRFTFTVIGDRTGAGLDSWKIFDRALADINRLKPEFTVMIGDLVEGAGNQVPELTLQWAEALSHLDSLKIPVFLVPGNHDIYDKGSYAAWKERFGSTYFAFTHHQCRFVILSTEEGKGTGEAGLGTSQKAFLRQELKDLSCPQIFLFMHRPLWLTACGEETDWKEIESIVGNRPVTFIAGHLHVLAARREVGRLYLIHGPTGASLRMDRNPALGFIQHFTMVLVDNGFPSLAFIEPGRIHGEAIALQAYLRSVQGMMLLK
jgi:hypothetical protein